MDRPSGVQNYPEQLLPSARSAGVIYLPYDLFTPPVVMYFSPVHCRGCLNKYQVSIWQTDQNIVALYLHSIGFNILAGRATYYLACMYIELRSMQGAGDYITIEFALAERTANMCA